MLYQKYRKRVNKISWFMQMLVKYRVAVIGVLASLIATVTGVVAISGAIVGGEECPQVIEYGQEINYDVSALMGEVTLEYASDDGTYRWSAAKPYRTGKYLVRARSERAFGIIEYGEEFNFEIVKKPIDVKADASKETIYGDLPELTGDLSPEDTFSCDGFEIEDKNALTTVVTPIRSAVKILDKDGNDVTNCYTVNVLSETIEFKKRPLTIESDSETKVYDGTPLALNGYAISDGNCVYDHEITCVAFSQSRTDVGTSDNTVSDAKIFSADGTEVTQNYAINYIHGKLTVTPRMVKITTGTAEKVYDGTELTCTVYTAEYVYPEDYEGERNLSALAVGQNFEIKEAFASIVNVKESGKVNAAVFGVKDGENDVTSNYAVTYEYGTLTVTPRPLTVKTASATFEYDGEKHFKTDILGDTSVAVGQNSVVKNVTEITNVSETQDGNNKFELDIFDGENNNVTENYTITYEYGTLTVTPRKITITTGNDSKVYNGDPLTCTDYTATYTGGGTITQAFVKGASLQVNASTSITDVQRDGSGKVISVDNKFTSYVIIDGDANNYEITLNNTGKLTVNKRPLTVKTASAAFEYDGVEHSKTGDIDFGDTSVADGQNYVINEKTLPSVTNVNDGKIDNVFTLIICDGNGNDVTSNYDINYTYGELKITPRPIFIITGSAEKVYDGKPLTCKDYKTVYYDGTDFLPGFVGDEKIIVNASTSITDVQRDGSGKVISVDNKFTSYVIIDGDANNYKITFKYGTLTVTKRKIVLTAGSATKVYDGKPLTSNVCSVSGDGLVQGDELQGVTVSGKRIDLGESKNTIGGDIKVISNNGDDVTGNYDIDTKEGTLTVTDEDPGDEDDDKNDDNSDEDNNDDDNNVENGGSGANSIGPGQYGNHGGKGEEQIGWIISSANEVVYLKDQSWGDYVNNQWQKFDGAYGEKIDKEYSYDDLVSWLLKRANYTSRSNLKVDLGGSYYKPQYVVLDSKNNFSLTGYKVSHYNVYQYSSLLEYILEYIKDPTFDDAYYEFVKKNYLNVGDSTKAFLIEFMNENGITSLDGVVEFMTKQTTYNLLYDTSLDSEADVIKAFLSDAKYKKQGVCYHFATAATLMLRTLGIPARMTSGYMVACEATKTTTITANDAHGWVEVYIENLGWITVDVTPASDGKAELESLKAIMQGHEITLIADSASKLYDGKPLDAPQSCKFDSETSALFDKYGIKYSATVTVSGSITEKGKTDSVIDSYSITVKFMGENINDWFTAVKTKKGTLEVIQKDVVTVYLLPKKITYDGKPHRFEDVEFYETDLPDGYTIEVKLSGLGSITNVGKLSYGSIYNYTTIKDAKGNVVTNEFFIRFTQPLATGTEKVVNENYSVWFNGALIEIVPLTLEVRSGDATATYAEDKTLKNETYTLSGSLAEGHEVKVIFTGERTAPGICQNTFGVKVYDAKGRDVTKNYKITPEYGTLTVKNET